MQYACVRIPCMRDAGSDALTAATCPANVRGGNVDCDPATDLLCQTSCTNSMRVTCLCAGGNNAQWTCTQPMDCQP